MKERLRTLALLLTAIAVGAGLTMFLLSLVEETLQ